MPDYSQGKIYTIRCRNDDSLIYVGSTCQKLCKRFDNHKRDCVNGVRLSLYNYIECWNDWYIELFEEYKCENKEQLFRREGEIIRQIGTINKHIAGRTKQEYYTDNIDKIKNQQEKYRFQHVEQIKQRKKEYAVENAEAIRQYKVKNAETIKQKQQEYNNKNSKTIKVQQRQYKDCNVEKIKEQQRQYRFDNHEKIKLQKQQTILCSCGVTVCRNNIKRHLKTKQHQLWEDTQKDKSNDIIDDYNRDKTT